MKRFIHVIDSMFNQHAKMAGEVEAGAEVAGAGAVVETC